MLFSVLRDPDSNPYSVLDHTETDQTADTDGSESQPLPARRRRSRRRRTDEDASLIDGLSESDNGSLSENGIVTVADYISRAESQSRQRNAKELKKNKKELGQVEFIEERGPSAATTTPNGSVSQSEGPEKAPAVATERAGYHGGEDQPAVLNGVS
ncbi:hypothetical protein COCON_G00058700 [Conger conger]|uniref:Uncharacterized protein n=1 Tax=Conger conger TaxID=82655 RepID=A0A9Q1DRM9_CONCO|nr:hypothetical protein COCON_G00058700 [Conger conger]